MGTTRSLVNSFFDLLILRVGFSTKQAKECIDLSRDLGNCDKRPFRFYLLLHSMIDRMACYSYIMFCLLAFFYSHKL